MSEGKQMSMDSAGLEYEIQQRGMALMDHGIKPEAIDNLIAAYTRFTINWPNPTPEIMSAMLPVASADEMAHLLDELDRSQNTGEWNKYKTNHPWIAKPGGFTDRSFQTSALQRARGIKLDDDWKEYYHYLPAGLAQIEAQHAEFEWGKVPSEVYGLHNAFQVVHTAGRILTEKTLAIVEETHPEVNRIITAQSIASSPVRLLFYHPGDVAQLGAAHYDKSTFTFQIAESHQGLRLARNEAAELEIVRRPADKAVFFPSKALSLEYPDTPYTPGWHDIINLKELNEGRILAPQTAEVCGRWAIIFFTNRADYVQPDKSLMHTR